MHISVILRTVAVWVAKILSSGRATICAFELCAFLGTLGKRTRRWATPSSNPKRQRLRQTAWNQARPTSSRSERGQPLAMVASAEDLSLKPAQCVSPFNYCQPASLERLLERKQGINTLQRALSVLCSASFLDFGSIGHIAAVRVHVPASSSQVVGWEGKSVFKLQKFVVLPA